MKILMIFLLSTLSVVAHANCDSELEDGIDNLKDAVAANNKFFTLYKDPDAYNLSNYEQCDKGVDLLKLARRASTYFYKASQNGQNIISLNCSYTTTNNKKNAQFLRYEAEMRSKEMYKMFNSIRPRVERNCSDEMTIPEMRNPAEVY